MAGFVGAGLGALGGALFEDMDALFGGGDDDLGDLGGVEDVEGEAEGAAMGGGGFEDYEHDEEEENKLMTGIEEFEYEGEDEDDERNQDHHDERRNREHKDELMNQIEDAEYEFEETKQREKEEDRDLQRTDHLLETIEEVDYEEAEGAKQDHQDGITWQQVWLPIDPLPLVSMKMTHATAIQEATIPRTGSSMGPFLTVRFESRLGSRVGIQIMDTLKESNCTFLLHEIRTVFY
jgi:hypothetical protein